MSRPRQDYASDGFSLDCCNSSTPTRTRTPVGMVTDFLLNLEVPKEDVTRVMRWTDRGWRPAHGTLSRERQCHGNVRRAEVNPQRAATPNVDFHLGADNIQSWRIFGVRSEGDSAPSGWNYRFGVADQAYAPKDLDHERRFNYSSFTSSKTAARFSTWQKLNPIWWLGNADEPVAPDWYRPGKSCRNLMWHLRNPFSQFRLLCYWPFPTNHSSCRSFPRRNVHPHDGWNWGVCRYYYLQLPYVSYGRGRVMSVLRLASGGAFGIELKLGAHKNASVPAQPARCATSALGPVSERMRFKASHNAAFPRSPAEDQCPARRRHPAPGSPAAGSRAARFGFRSFRAIECYDGFNPTRCKAWTTPVSTVSTS